jgi:hypothetical protein
MLFFTGKGIIIVPNASGLFFGAVRIEMGTKFHS